MPGFDNDVVNSPAVRIEATASADALITQKTSTDIGILNVDGTPESVLAANVGSLALDRTNGAIYIKGSGTGNTGWEEIASGSDITSSDSLLTVTPMGGTVDLTANQAVASTSAFTDNVVIRADGATRRVQSSGVTIDDSDVCDGITQLNVDNLRLDGNTLSSTDTNGNVILDPDGTGDVQVASGDVDVQGGAVVVDPGGATDSFIQFNESTTGKWRIGNDATDDSYRLSQGSALGTNDTFIMTSAGERTMPLQPAFLAYVNTTITNVVGDATVYTLIPDTEVYDQNSDFTLASGTFTAPVTGKYSLGGVITVSGGTSISLGSVLIAASNRTLRAYLPLLTGATTGLCGCIEGKMDMDAADVATFDIGTTDSGGKIDDIAGVSNGVRTYVQGVLVC